MTHEYSCKAWLLACFFATLVLAACVTPSPTVPIAPAPTITLAPPTTAIPSPTSAEPTATSHPEPVVTVGTARFVVEVADTSDKRSQGLSGRPSLAPGTGMLFVFDSEGVFHFWMREMQIPLDFVWISSGCTAADLTADVPPPEPDTSPQDLPRYQPSMPVQYVLEINAGVIASEGISEGDPVVFGGTLEGEYGC